jgi:hypothetical protein
MNQPPGAEERWICSEFVDQSNTFFELTGEVGDVFILHPLVIHSAAKNGLRIPRIITNPSVSLKKPFNFDRDDRSEYSLIELKTLKELGRERLNGWRITGQRRGLVSTWAEEQERERDELESELAQRYHESLMLYREPPPIPPRFVPPRPGSDGGRIRLE